MVEAFVRHTSGSNVLNVSLYGATGCGGRPGSIIVTRDLAMEPVGDWRLVKALFSGDVLLSAGTKLLSGADHAGRRQVILRYERSGRQWL